MSSFIVTPTGGSGALTQIAQTITAASAQNVTFSSIVATYSSLILTVIGRGDTSATDIDLRVQFNADTGNNYNSQVSLVAGTGDTNSESLASASIRSGQISAATATANYAGSMKAVISGYAQTTFFKSLHGTSSGSRNTSTNGQLAAVYSGLWANTAAITSIKIFPSAGNFVNGSIVTLYGMQ